MKGTLVLALLLAPLTTLHAAPASLPDIILVMPDDVGGGDYACLGNPVIHTPSVDQFKQQGVALTAVTAHLTVS